MTLKARWKASWERLHTSAVRRACRHTMMKSLTCTCMNSCVEFLSSVANKSSHTSFLVTCCICPCLRFQKKLTRVFIQVYHLPCVFLPGGCWAWRRCHLFYPSLWDMSDIHERLLVWPFWNPCSQRERERKRDWKREISGTCYGHIRWKQIVIGH